MAYPSTRQPVSFVSAATRSKVAIGLLIVVILSELIAIAGGFSQAGLLSRGLTEGGIAPEEGQANDARMAAIGIFQMAAFWSSAIAFLAWLHRASRAAASFGSAYMEFTPASSVWWWFVPIANLFKPFQAVMEVWKASSPNATGATSWQAEPNPPLLYVWWTLWIVTNILANIFMRMSFGALRDPTIEDLIRMTNVGIAYSGMSVIAACVAIAVVYQINQRQERKRHLAQSAVSHVAGVAASYGSSYPPAYPAVAADPVAHYNRGVGYYQANDMARAIEEYQAAIRLNPNFAEAHYSLGLAYLAMGNRDAASIQVSRLQSISLDWAQKLNQLIQGG